MKQNVNTLGIITNARMRGSPSRKKLKRRKAYMSKNDSEASEGKA